MDSDNEDMQETVPTLDDWLEHWEAALIAGQTTISRKEAERRYTERYPDVD